jgi:hypothetical protein
METVSPCLTNGEGLMATGMLQQHYDRRAESFVREPGAGPVSARARTPTLRDNGEDSWTGWRRPSTRSRLIPTPSAFLNEPGITRGRTKEGTP